jgi:hypothetical protein
MAMEVSVEKLTGIELLRRAAGFTTGAECRMSLKTAYRNQHSIIRTQIFFVEMRDIPLFVASQLVRSHVGVQFFQRSKRSDRGGEDFKGICKSLALDIVRLSHEEKPDVENGEALMAQYVGNLPSHFDRYAPTDIAFICNAEMLINTSHKRLCSKASAETSHVWELLRAAVERVDADLAAHFVPQCIYRGGICPEPKSCRFPESKYGEVLLAKYKDLFK